MGFRWDNLQNFGSKLVKRLGGNFLSKYLTGEMLCFFAEFDHLMQWLHLGCCVIFLLFKNKKCIWSQKSISTHKNKFVLGYKKWRMRGGVVGLLFNILIQYPYCIMKFGMLNQNLKTALQNLIYNLLEIEFNFGPFSN